MKNTRQIDEFVIRPDNNIVLSHNDMSYNDITVTKRIYREGLKRNILTNVKFDNAQLLRCAFAGSMLKNVKFSNTVMKGNAWTTCVFNCCEFENKTINTLVSSNFSNSTFFNCNLKNISIAASSFIKTQFINCRFETCTIASATFEDALFRNCEFFNCDIGATNLEFCEFRSCRFKETILPLYHICYITGGVEHALDIENKIILKSKRTFYPSDVLYTLYERIIDYYTKTNQYFALANAAVINKNYEAVKNYIFDGINYYLANKNFRMIKHLCKLGKIKGVLDVHQGKRILDLVDNFLVTQKSSTEELSSYIMHSADLRSLLYDYNGTESMLTIEIQTNIKPEEQDKVNSLINKLSTVIDEYDNVNHNIQIRHNSPFLLFCTVVGMVSGLVAIAKDLFQLGCFIYKKVKSKKEKPVNSEGNASITINVSGDLVVADSYVKNNPENYEINNNINTVTSKLITQKGVAITKIERK